MSRSWGEVVWCRCTLGPALEQLVRLLQPGRRLSRLYHSHAINIIQQLCGRVVAVHLCIIIIRITHDGALAASQAVHCLL